jgi:hypothetical protein
VNEQDFASSVKMRPMLRGRLTDLAIFTGLTAYYLITLYVDKDALRIAKIPELQEKTRNRETWC